MSVLGQRQGPVGPQAMYLRAEANLALAAHILKAEATPAGPATGGPPIGPAPQGGKGA